MAESQSGMVIDEKTVGIWFLPTTENQDWMATVREIEPDAKYELVYRFRYYKDDKVFDSEDEKNWYKATATGTRAFVLAGIRMAASMMAEHAIGKLYEIINDGDFAEFSRKFMDAPFVFARQVTKEETSESEVNK